MYDWIPMAFRFGYRHQDGSFAYYNVTANSGDRISFAVYYPDGHLCVDDYMQQQLLGALRHGSTINGMTIDELQEAYDNSADNIQIDISSLI